MEQINFDIFHQIGNRQKLKATSERAELIQSFVEELNKDRKDYKPVNFGQINGKTSHIDLENLRWFLGECKKAKIFGAYFWGKLKK